MLCALMTAYRSLFLLRGGAAVQDLSGATLVRDASRFLRDAIVICTRGLMTTDLQEDLIALLKWASENVVGAPGRGRGVVAIVVAV